MKILRSIDESKFSQGAIRTLIGQVRTKGTEIRVLHVVEPIAGYMSADMIPHFVSYVAEVEEDRRKQAKGDSYNARLGNFAKKVSRRVKLWM
jgi:hypothetical protein